MTYRSIPTFDDVTGGLSVSAVHAGVLMYLAI